MFWLQRPFHQPVNMKKRVWSQVRPYEIRRGQIRTRTGLPRRAARSVFILMLPFFQKNKRAKRRKLQITQIPGSDLQIGHDRFLARAFQYCLPKI